MTCKTCNSERCSNHAACARRAVQKVELTKKQATWWLNWHITMLLLGVHAALDHFTSIEDGEQRQNGLDVFLSALPTPKLRLMVALSTSEQSLRERLVVVAVREILGENAAASLM